MWSTTNIATVLLHDVYEFSRLFFYRWWGFLHPVTPTELVTSPFMCDNQQDFHAIVKFQVRYAVHVSHMVSVLVIQVLVSLNFLQSLHVHAYRILVFVVPN